MSEELTQQNYNPSMVYSETAPEPVKEALPVAPSAVAPPTASIPQSVNNAVDDDTIEPEFKDGMSYQLGHEGRIRLLEAFQQAMESEDAEKAQRVHEACSECQLDPSASLMNPATATVTTLWRVAHKAGPDFYSMAWQIHRNRDTSRNQGGFISNLENFALTDTSAADGEETLGGGRRSRRSRKKKEYSTDIVLMDLLDLEGDDDDSPRKPPGGTRGRRSKRQLNSDDDEYEDPRMSSRRGGRGPMGGRRGGMQNGGMRMPPMGMHHPMHHPMHRGGPMGGAPGFMMPPHFMMPNQFRPPHMMAPGGMAPPQMRPPVGGPFMPPPPPGMMQKPAGMMPNQNFVFNPMAGMGASGGMPQPPPGMVGHFPPTGGQFMPQWAPVPQPPPANPATGGMGAPPSSEGFAPAPQGIVPQGGESGGNDETELGGYYRP